MKKVGDEYYVIVRGTKYRITPIPQYDLWYWKDQRESEPAVRLWSCYPELLKKERSLGRSAGGSLGRAPWANSLEGLIAQITRLEAYDKKHRDDILSEFVIGERFVKFTKNKCTISASNCSGFRFDADSIKQVLNYYDRNPKKKWENVDLPGVIWNVDMYPSKIRIGCQKIDGLLLKELLRTMRHYYGSNSKPKSTTRRKVNNPLQ